MIKQLGLMILTLALALVVAFIAVTEDVRAQKRDDPAEKKEEPKKGEAKPDQQPGGDKEAADKIKKLIERLHENMDASEDKLGKKDTGEETRKVQDQIVRDLDELIKQQSQGGGGGGGGGASSSSGGGGKGSKGSSSGSSGANSSGGNSGGKGGKGGAKNDPQTAKGNGESKKPMGVGEKKDDGKKDGDVAKGGAGKDPQKKGGSGGGLGGKGKDGDNTVSDLFKDPWGWLPQRKRDEMDAYSRERFLPKYEELLRQYYRTISEQGRRKEGD